MNPETIGVVILLVVFLGAEIIVHRRATVVKRHVAEIVRQQRGGFAVLLLLIPVALVTWTAGWFLGQKRVCDQYRASGQGECVWKTGTVVK